MSSIQNVITTTFRARGNQAIATMGGVAQGFGTIMGRIGETSRMSERLNNQWRALGTTFRYAIAGTAIFGGVQMARNLRDLQRQVGLLQALGEAQNGIFPNTNTSIGQLLSDSRREAVLAVTDINDFNEGLINMFSSVQNVPENKAAEMMKEISLTAQLAQTDSESASKAIFGMLQTFRLEPNLENIQKASRAITELIASVPGGPEAGRQIFQQFPQLAAVIQMGRGTIPQMLGLYESLLRTGGTPATAGRGLQFLMQTVAFPEQQTKASRRALASVGITPKYVEERGVVAALLRLIEAIRTRGGISATGPARTLSDDELEALTEQAGGVAKAMSDLGISGAGNRLAAAAIPRIHGVRALALLAARPEQTIADLQAIDDAWNGYNNAIEVHANRIKNLTDPQSMNKAAIAMQGFQQQILLAFEPIANLASRGIIRLGEFANNHQDATRNAALGTAAFLGALGIGRFVGVRRLLGMGGRGFVMAKAAEDAATQGQMGFGASPQNPLYVIVVGQIFGNNTKGPLPGGGGPDLPPVVAGSRRGLRGVVGRVLRSPVGKGLGVAGLVAAAHEFGIDTLVGKSIGIPDRYSGKSGWGALFHDLGMRGDERAARGEYGPRNVQEAIRYFRGDQQNINAFDRLKRAQAMWGERFGTIHGTSEPTLGRFHGRAEVFITLETKDPQTGKITRKRVHVPVTMWEGGRAPSNAGKSGTKRGG